MRLASAQAAGSSEGATEGLGRRKKKRQSPEREALLLNLKELLSLPFRALSFFYVYPGFRSLLQSSLLPGLKQAAFSMLYVGLLQLSRQGLFITFEMP